MNMIIKKPADFNILTLTLCTVLCNQLCDDIMCKTRRSSVQGKIQYQVSNGNLTWWRKR